MNVFAEFSAALIGGGQREDIPVDERKAPTKPEKKSSFLKRLLIYE
jgi:hypothetical protein